MKIILIQLLLFFSLEAMAKSKLNKDIYIDNANSLVRLNISRSDVNRLVFPSNVKEKVVSNEKGLLVKVIRNEVFVKFTPFEEKEITHVKDQVITTGKAKIKYNKNNKSEIFIVTENKTYSLMLNPVKKPTTTIYFTETFKEKKKNIIGYIGSEYIDTLVNKVIKPILQNKKLSNYKTFKFNKSYIPIHLISQRNSLLLKHKKTHKGYIYNIYEYEIKNPNSIPLQITDSKELLKATGLEPKAYSIYYDNRIYKILPNQTAKLIVVVKAL